MKKRTIFRDTVDRYQFVNSVRVPIPQFDDLPIKRVKTEYVVTEITANGQERHVFDRDGLEDWKEKNKDGLDDRIYYKLVMIEEVNVFEADI